jgi:putative membrane protein insertion efficiency factor
MGTDESVVKALCVCFLRCYQWVVSPVLGPHCRFTPTCSQYMIDAIRIHGAVKGLFLGVKRLGRCHPLSSGGSDPVKQKEGHHGI